MVAHKAAKFAHCFWSFAVV